MRLVREGYEGAFEEIVRRYRRPLGSFAASIVGGRHEDVTQDSFRKALEALRAGDAEIELRPWLYRIVRNTALNDLRDRPPAAAELAEDLVAGTRSAAAEAEAREEVAELIDRLRALPENQRAALLMRELDGMSHEEIAAALGISKGAARQAIARGRAAMRSALGALLPLPWLRSLLDGTGSIEAGVGTGALAGAGASAIGAGGAGALKIGLATVVVAGSLGAGVAIDHSGTGHAPHQRHDSVAREPKVSDDSPSLRHASEADDIVAPSHDSSDDSGTDDHSHGRGGGDGGGHHGHGESDRRDRDGRGRDDGGDDHGGGHGGTDGDVADRSPDHSGPGPGGKDSSGGGPGHGSGGGHGSDSHGGPPSSTEAAASPPAEVPTSGGPGPSSSSSGDPGPSSTSSSSGGPGPSSPSSSGGPGSSSGSSDSSSGSDDSSGSGGGGGGSSGGPGPSGDS